MLEGDADVHYWPGEIVAVNILLMIPERHLGEITNGTLGDALDPQHVCKR